MYISKGFMESQVYQVFATLQATSALYLYSGQEPTNSEIATNGFVVANYAPQLLGTVSTGTSAC